MSSLLHKLKEKISIKSWFVILVSTSLFATACNQVGLGALTATRNAIISPVDGISNIISNNRYNAIEERTPSEATIPDNGQIEFISTIAAPIACESVAQQDSLGLPLEITEVIEAARDSACSCRSWGSCEKSVCSCDELCPNNFNIFKRTPYESSLLDLTSRENSLSFRNNEAMELSNIEGTSGYCWGHASLTSQFNRLASFDSENTRMKDNLDAAPGSPERAEALTFFKQAIDDIGDNKVANFPGFSNLYELSSHPEFESYLADKVARAWADRAMSYQALRTALGTGSMNRETSVAFLEQIAQKIDNHQQPQIVFTSEGQFARTHALLVSHYQRTDKGLILCLRDNNYDPTTNVECENQMTLNEDGGLTYAPWGRLGRAALAHNDNSDALAQFHSLKEECDRLKGCL